MIPQTGRQLQFTSSLQKSTSTNRRTFNSCQIYNPEDNLRATKTELLLALLLLILLLFPLQVSSLIAWLSPCHYGTTAPDVNFPMAISSFADINLETWLPNKTCKNVAKSAKADGQDARTTMTRTRIRRRKGDYKTLCCRWFTES